jgi:hypothetical protein
MRPFERNGPRYTRRRFPWRPLVLMLMLVLMLLVLLLLLLRRHLQRQIRQANCLWRSAWDKTDQWER